jgi:PAS domain S-box-containing protein
LTPEIKPEGRLPKPFLPRLSLRAKAMVVLSVPMAALFAGLYILYWAESAAYDADRTIERAYDRRIELMRRGPRSGIEELLRVQDRTIVNARARRDKLRHLVLGLAAACGVVGPIAALLVHMVVTGRLTKRVRAVERNAYRLAHGLPLSTLPEAADEIGILGRQIADAAQRMRARERELRESESRYKDLFDRAPVPFEETDRWGVVRRFNQEVCTLLKCSPERILGGHAWDFVAPDQREVFRQAMMERVEAAAETPPFECEYLLDDGSRIVVEIRESVVKSDGGEVTGVCWSLLDVTERKLAAVAARKVAQYAMELRNKNEQLAHALAAARSATDAKSRFLASMSHELRTPLNGIIGFSELLYDGKLGPISEDHRDILGDILASARHLLQLISDILDLSKVEAGRMEFNPEHGELDPLVQEVRDVIRPLAERKAIQLSTEVPAGFCAAVDRSRFKQVLYNYLSNAVKFTPEGGRVVVRIGASGDCLRLEVEDTGIGIEPDDVSRLFQDFQQLATSRKADQGTGLGLALTRHIVEAQGGTVGVQSTPGAGSLFSAVLPLEPKNSVGSTLE